MTRPVPLYRPNDAARVIAMAAAGHCVAIVGLSNFGKSTLLRGLSSTDCASSYERQSGRTPLFVYVDCNRMLELTVQGFYEVILRAILEILPEGNPGVGDKIESLYHRIIEPGSTFGVPLAFNDAFIRLIGHSSYDAIFLLAEIE